ncbi:universal stress protein [Streptomyces mirabilis]|uniref:universal stress protein n=1 Tax=Streptomyces mirabilis TaxID=68239 RepID=UPI0036CF41DC
MPSLSGARAFFLRRYRQRLDPMSGGPGAERADGWAEWPSYRPAARARVTLEPCAARGDRRAWQAVTNASCSARGTPVPARRRCGSPSARPRRVAAPSTSCAPGGAPRARPQITPVRGTGLRPAGHPAARRRARPSAGPGTHYDGREVGARTQLVRRSAAADLVIVGARRGQSPLGLRPGRIAHALLHDAQCPVAVAPLSG